MTTLYECPGCGSSQVTATEETMFMINTIEHYCNSIRLTDEVAKASCLTCGWEGYVHYLTKTKSE